MQSSLTEVQPAVQMILSQIRTDGDVPRVSSRDVAVNFGKEHKHILEAIDGLECSNDFRQPNFRPSEYVNSQGKTQREFLLTRDGCVFLAMGFTGAKAARFKEAYIAAFNELEQRHKALTQPVTALALLEGMFAAIREQDVKLGLVQEAVGRTETAILHAVLTSEQITQLDAAMRERVREIGTPPGISRSGQVYGLIRRALKAKFLPYGSRSEMTWKEISSRHFEAALEFVRAWTL